MAVSESGQLYAWGDCTHGELGYGGLTGQELPRYIKSLATHTIVAVAAGAHHSVALTEKGHVYTFGRGLEVLPVHMWGWRGTGGG